VSRIAVLGEAIRTEPFALAGAFVIAADTPEAVRAAWRSLPDDVAVVVVTPQATAALGAVDVSSHDGVLVVTLP
jgi:vacuolar-type H+-ATPase subunit F/Vma7